MTNEEREKTKERARLYSMNYYTFVEFAKSAGANIRIKKNVVIDLAKVDKEVSESKDSWLPSIVTIHRLNFE